MKNNHKNNPNKRQRKDKVSVLKYIKARVENGTGLVLSELKKEYNEEQLFFIALKYITTTKKALCKALDIPVEAGCRYKRKYEKQGLLVESIEDIVCPYTMHPAKRLSTNPDEFDDLTHTNQLTLF
ncbi:hypothetical protein GCM10022393_27720 [Aquimarina addita]|uniref:Helix-turn-helix domain-containing protein n=1 Tax=Aquimarina addita TaxID=870485 RepID=A0ABP6UM20_9FLAO